MRQEARCVCSIDVYRRIDTAEESKAVHNRKRLLIWAYFYWPIVSSGLGSITHKNEFVPLRRNLIVPT